MKKFWTIFPMVIALAIVLNAGYASGISWPQAGAGSTIFKGLALPVSNCGIINLEEYADQYGGSTDNPHCANACSFSSTVVFVPQTPGA